jgi:hypothetical protein
MGQRAGRGVVFMVRTLLSALTAATVVAGCGGGVPQPILTPIEVKVPIATPIYCDVAKLDKPALPLSALKPDSAPADTIRAYAATVAILKGAVTQRDSVIAGCAAPASVLAGSHPAGEKPDDAPEDQK